MPLLFALLFFILPQEAKLRQREEMISKSIALGKLCYNPSSWYISPPLGAVGAAQDKLSGLQTTLDIFSITSYHHGNKATTCGKSPRLRPIGGTGDLTNTLTNIQISAGGHRGQ